MSRGWQKQGECRQHDPDLWFPEGPAADLDATEAKRICVGCPVRQLCLNAAMQREGGSTNRHGIFGGLDEQERTRLYRRGMRAAARDMELVA